MATIVDSAVVAAALGVGLASAIALAARWSWLAELFTHFRVQYLAVQLPLVIALLWLRRRFAATLMLLLVASNVASVWSYWPRPGATPQLEDGTTLMTVNLNVGNHDVERLLALLRREQPDVIVILELDREWANALEVLAPEYAGRRLVPREDPFGIAVLSRRGLESSRTIDLRGAAAIDTRVTLGDGRSVRLLGVHLWPPESQALARERNAQLAELRGIVQAIDEPLIVTGDFNATPYSPVLADWLATSGLRDPRQGRGFAMTWPSFLPLLGIPIDHCFSNAHVMVTEPRRSAAFGSDHFAITAHFELRRD